MSSSNSIKYLSLAILLLAGCKGIQTKDEKLARQQLHNVAAQYRPQDQKPALPSLTTNSTLGDFLKFAMLNQPAVEAAYYEWSASVERITTARSRPDPQFTFQMDIQNIVSSVMPGFMVNFPGAGKLRAAAAIASAESDAKYFAFESAVLESAYEVKRTYHKLHFLDEKMKLVVGALNFVCAFENGTFEGKIFGVAFR